MTTEIFIALIAAVLLLVYLIVALLWPEKC
jgi:K+-transporting ATPase KdpF subunit